MMKVIFEEDNIFASHPANHGSWQRGNECLFGILTGKRGNGLYHKIEEPYTKILLRSYDYGKNWSKEIPNQDFECKYVNKHPQLNIENNIVRVCGSYDTGGDDCIESGGFYYSEDFGKTWSDPYLFSGLEEFSNKLCTSRTSQLFGENILFLSYRDKKSWGTDDVYMIKYNYKDNIFSVVSKIPKNGGRCVMPSATRIDEKSIIVATRRIEFGENFIEVFLSKNNGISWDTVTKFTTGINNGNPPSILYHENIIYCFFANRYSESLNMITSKDGISWNEYIIEKDIGKDIGYPVSFSSKDGPFVIIYCDGIIKMRNI